MQRDADSIHYNVRLGDWNHFTMLETQMLAFTPTKKQDCWVRISSISLFNPWQVSWRLYAPGGFLDSQTTDTQWEDNLYPDSYGISQLNYLELQRRHAESLSSSGTTSPNPSPTACIQHLTTCIQHLTTCFRHPTIHFDTQPPVFNTQPAFFDTQSAFSTPTTCIQHLTACIQHLTTHFRHPTVCFDTQPPVLDTV